MKNGKVSIYGIIVVVSFVSDLQGFSLSFTVQMLIAIFVVGALCIYCLAESVENGIRNYYFKKVRTVDSTVFSRIQKEQNLRIKEIRMRRKSSYFVLLFLIVVLGYLSRNVIARQVKTAISDVIQWAQPESKEKRLDYSENSEKNPANTEQPQPYSAFSNEDVSFDQEEVAVSSWENIKYQETTRKEIKKKEHLIFDDMELKSKYIPALFAQTPVGKKDELEMVSAYLDRISPKIFIKKISILGPEKLKELEWLNELINQIYDSSAVLTCDDYYQEAEYYSEMAKIRGGFDDYYQQGRALLDGMSKDDGTQYGSRKLLKGCQALECIYTALTDPDVQEKDILQGYYLMGQIYYHMAECGIVDTKTKITLYYFAAECYLKSLNDKLDNQTNIYADFYCGVVLYKANNLMKEDSAELLEIVLDIFEKLQNKTLEESILQELTRYSKEIHLKTDNFFSHSK